MAIIIILIVIIAAPFVYREYKDNIFNPTNDKDGDKIPDDKDAFPNDPNEWKDSDNDGIGDNADSDDDDDGVLDSQDYIPNKDAAIRVEINKIRILDPRKPFDKTALIVARVTIDDTTYEIPNETGKELPIDQDMTVNWTIKQNVPDDIGNYDITVAIYYKTSSSESIIDINGIKNERNDEGRIITIDYYLGNKIGNQYPSDSTYAFSDGFDDGNKGLFDEKDAQIWYRIITIDNKEDYY